MRVIVVAVRALVIASITVAAVSALAQTALAKDPPGLEDNQGSKAIPTAGCELLKTAAGVLTSVSDPDGHNTYYIADSKILEHKMGGDQQDSVIVGSASKNPPGRWYFEEFGGHMCSEQRAVRRMLRAESELRPTVQPISLALDPASGEILFCDRFATIRRADSTEGGQVVCQVIPEEQASFESKRRALILEAVANQAKLPGTLLALQLRAERTPFCSLLRSVNRQGRYEGTITVFGSIKLPRDIVRLIGQMIDDPAHHYRTLLTRQCVEFLRTVGSSN